MAEVAGTAVVLAAQSLAVDQVTAEVVTALRAAGMDPILLKGPSIAQWLYPTDFRPYGDTDLLVAPEEFTRAARLLRRLGFGHPAKGRATHAHTYRRAGSPLAPPLCVDLHRTLPYLAAPPSDVWPVLSHETATLRVADVDVRVLGVPQRVLHIAIHAVQHAFESKNPFEDLRRALAVVSAEQLQETVDISRSLGAEDALVTGLNLIPEGQAMVARLGLDPPRRDILRFGGSSEVEAAAYQLQRIADARSWRERIDLSLDMVFVSPAILREGSALARRGPAGLMAAYAARPWVLARRMGPALLRRRRILHHHE
jgi:hypothetical protein